LFLFVCFGFSPFFLDIKNNFGAYIYRTEPMSIARFGERSKVSKRYKKSKKFIHQMFYADKTVYED